ncbi:MAG: DNA primase [Clostridia bacterium]|nr:DNA primase [Clostridia bacterium]
MAKLLPPEWLDELKSRSDIVDVISRYVPLKRNGREFVGCCPFHHEKTPSFFVYPDSQSYHCFGCKESGDTIKFLSKYENLGFIETVERLANSANMPMPEMGDTNAQEIARKKQERTLILSALKDAARYYFSNLNSTHPQALKARQYIEKRKLTRESVVRFGIGCSLDFDSLLVYLKGKGYTLDILKKAGLVGENGGRIFDAYGKRLTFPLISKDGDVVGFSARLLEDKELAKYKNTINTPVFNKSEMVFAINLLKKLRDNQRASGAEYDGLNNLIIVEGQIDVITMHEFGFTNTVACLGTALTPMHARKLKQFSENIVLLLDGDGAGRKAALRSIDVLRNSALNVRVATLPDGYDPDEYLRKFGAEEMRKLIDNATEGIEYKIDVLAKTYDLNEPSTRAKFVHESLVVLKRLDNQSEQDVYLPIVHKYSETPIDILRMDLANIDEQEKSYFEREDDEDTTQNIEPEKEVKKDNYTLADLFILASILYNKEYARDVDTAGLVFTDMGLNQSYEYIMKTRDNGGTPSLGGLYSYMEVDSSTPLLRELVKYEFLPDDFPDLTLRSYVLKNRERSLKMKRDNAQTACKNATDSETRNQYLREAFEINKELELLKKDMEKLNTECAARKVLTSKQKQKRTQEE